MCRRGRFYNEENGRVFRYVLAEVCWQEETRGRLTRSGNYFSGEFQFGNGKAVSH